MANKKDISYSSVKMGMNRDSHISNLKPEEYTHAKNSNFEDDNGNEFNIQNEHSNLLASRFKDGYRVIGLKNDPFSNKVYYFLLNPKTNTSEIGYIENVNTLPNLGDTITECKECEYKVDLSTPLEDQVQQEIQVYTTLLNDSCNGCLNFDINFPIKTTEIKNEKCGRVIYFTDNLNPPRYIELDNINKYTYTGEELCGDDTTVIETCVACEKMRIFKRSRIFDIVPSQIVLGGNLKMGMYEFLGAYCDESGNELSRYFSITNPISIFDRENNILQQPDLASETNFAIKLNIQGLDLRYTHYKIAVVQMTDVNRATSYFVEGVHSTSDNTVVYTTDKDKQRTTLANLTVPSTRVDKWKFLASSNGYLFGGGITRPKQMNLQPVINLMGIFLNWQSYIAKENLYEDGVASAKYKGYYREETYPIGIRFLLDGEYTPTFPFIGRPATTTDNEIIPETNKDRASASKLAGSCIDATIEKRWQIYDTASELGRCSLSENIPTNTITEEEEKICYVEPNKQTHITLTGVAGSANINIDDEVYPISFLTDLNTTASDFVTTNSAIISTNHNGLTLTSSDNILIFDGVNADYESITLSPVEENLNGQVITNNYLTKEPNGSFSINLDEADEYTDLQNFIKNNKEDCLSNPSIYPFCSLLNVANYAADNCTPIFNDGCEAPILQSQEINIVDVVGEKTQKIEKIFPEEYSVLPPPSNCNLHARDFTTGGKQDDFYFRHGWMVGDGRGVVGPPPYPIGTEYWTGLTYKRNYDSVNESCSYAEEIPKYNPQIGFVNGYFHNYYGSDLQITTEAEQIVDLQLDYSSVGNSDSGATLDTGVFTDKIHKGALWFKKEMSNDRKIILSLSPQNVPADQDQISEAFLLPDDPINKEVRISFFDNCNSNAAIHSEVINLTQGTLYMIQLNEDNHLVFTDINGDTTISPNPVISEGFHLAIDVPLIKTFGMEDPSVEAETMWDQPRVSRMRTMPTQGCFSVNLTDILYDRVEVNFTNILISKKETYTSQCTYEVPVLEDCEAYPDRFGEFAYTESTEEYPDNEDLYNSSWLKIRPEDIIDGEYFSGTSFKQWLEDKYTQPEVDANGHYVWKTDPLNNNKPVTDFRCEPIRHFKMPGNGVSPFMYENNMAGFTESIIYPLGITIYEEIISNFLDIAVSNGLITEDQRSTITGYEIVRGDRTANESIVAKGITFDMMKYREDNKEILYSNYPFNDIGPDRLNYKDEDRNNFIEHPYNGTQNENWTFHSPETDYNKITSPAFMKVDGYMYGRSRGNFATVRDHPEYTILGRNLEKLASTLATTEVITETAVKSAQAFSNVNWLVGFANTVVPGGLISSIIILAIEAFSSMSFKYARYKYEWLQTFKNLGSPKNFASYYAAEGYYNYFKPQIEEGEMLRYLNVSKNIKDGRIIISDTVGGEKLEINHVDREDTVLLGVGSEFPIVYDGTYSEYDNGSVDMNAASRTFASENNACEQGISKDITRNVASMYVTLKEYLPSQYGEIGSIRWLTTGYRGDLSNPRTDCLGIFGGDVFITRHTLKRSMPMFVTTAMNQASLTPFEYKRYSNIGTEPRFYVNYEINNQDTSAGRPIPTVESVYNFDCFAGTSGDYIEHPSKFYLYYHGVPNFLVETTINTWNRYAKPEPWNNFYPNVGDLMEWTQEVVTPIRRGNSFFYNPTYSKEVTQTATLTLPVNYNKEEYDCKTDSPNGVMYSGRDSSENAYIDSWLTFKPLDAYEFDSEYGEFVGLRGIETQQVLARFENTSVIFNAIDTLVDDGTNPQTAELGTGGIFARRPRTFSNTELGHMGSQTQSMVSCEYGHFYTDAKRGQIFKINPGGKGFEEISAYSNGQPSGMEKWFKKQLPFKILKSFPEADIDNPYNKIGITMGWDSVYNRVFVTKKDYVPINDCVEYREEECTTTQTCPEGYTYNEETGRCEGEGECGSGLDMVFVIDVTTSQQNAIDAIKNNISTKIIPAITAKFGTNYRLGLVSVLDTRIVGEPLYEVVVPMGMTNDAQFITALNALVLGGEFNTNWPEPTDLALDAVLNNLQELDMNGTIIPSNTIGVFRPEAEKTIILTTDAMPSGFDDAYDYTDWLKADAMANLASAENIKIFSISTPVVAEPPVEEPVAGVTVPPLANVQRYLTYIMQNYATKTGGKYYYKQDGIGIDDSIVDAIENNTDCSVYPIQVTTCVPAGFFVKESCGGGVTGCPDGYTYNPVTDMCDPSEECLNNLDLVFIIDATGSQQNAIDSIKNALSTLIVPAIVSKYDTYRLGLVSVKDRRVSGEALYDIVTPMALTNEISFTTGLNTLVAGGGEFLEEPTDMALKAVLNNTQEIDLNGDVVPSDTIGIFRENTARAIMLITDNLPSGLNDHYSLEDWLHVDALSEQASLENIQIFPILTSVTEPPEDPTPPPSLTYLMKNYALKTGGTYYFKSMGAGIDTDVVDAIQNQIDCGNPIPPIETALELSNEDYFKDVSWTISYNLKSGKWGSFFDFKPNYYVSHNEYFQTGINTTSDPSEFGVWSHLLTNKSYNVFYGKAYDWEIEIPVTNKNVSKYLETFTYDLDVRRYHNDYDYAENKNIGFEEAVIWNHSNSSGKLKLDIQKTISQISKYPKTNGDTQSILQVSQDSNFTFNYFYNRVKKETAGLPLWNWDDNQIDKQLNQQAISFYSKSVLERLKGDTLLINLKSSESQHKKIFKIAQTKENLYDH